MFYNEVLQNQLDKASERMKAVGKLPPSYVPEIQGLVEDNFRAGARIVIENFHTTLTNIDNIYGGNVPPEVFNLVKAAFEVLKEKYGEQEKEEKAS